MIASLGLLVYAIAQVITKWEELKATAKFLPRLAGAKISDSIAGLFGGDINAESQVRADYGKNLEDIAYKKAGNVAPGAEGPAYRPELLGGNKAQAPAGPTYGPYQQGQPDQNGQIWEKVPQTNVNQSNNIVINTTDGAAGGKAAAREIVRGTQKAYR
jgi:hypothetical protein